MSFVKYSYTLYSGAWRHFSALFIGRKMKTCEKIFLFSMHKTRYTFKFSWFATNHFHLYFCIHFFLLSILISKISPNARIRMSFGPKADSWFQFEKLKKVKNPREFHSNAKMNPNTIDWMFLFTIADCQNRTECFQPKLLASSKWFSFMKTYMNNSVYYA